MAESAGSLGRRVLAWVIIIAVAVIALKLAFGIVFVAIVVHSLFYNALFEDPMFWGLLALTGLCARLPLRRPPSAVTPPQEPSDAKPKVTA